MKKKYEKPMIAISLFELQQNIAAACSGYKQGSSFGEPSSSDIYSCGWDTGGAILWISEPACFGWFLDEDEDFNGICYNNPSGGTSIFGAS